MRTSWKDPGLKSPDTGEVHIDFGRVIDFTLLHGADSWIRIECLLPCKLLAAIAMASFAGVVSAQQAPAPPAPSSTAKPTAAAPAEAQSQAAIPLAEVATQAELATANLRDIERAVSSIEMTEAVGKALPRVAREIDARVRETSKLLARNPSLEALRSIEGDWHKVRDSLSAWTRELTRHATQLDRQIARLNELDEIWKQTLALTKAEDTPHEVVKHVQSMIAATERTHELVEKQRAQILSLQSRVARQDSRVAQSLADIRLAREDALTRLLAKDSPPIWSSEVRSRVTETLAEDGQKSFTAQMSALRSYAEAQTATFIGHALVFTLIAAALVLTRRRARDSLAQEPAAERVARVFEVPIATAALLVILVSFWLYPNGPRLLWAIVGALALIPTIVVLRKLVERRLFPVLNALIACYFVDVLRDVAVTLPTLSRLLFIAEMSGAIVFLLWLIKVMRRSVAAGADHVARVTRICARFALALLTAALGANALGYVTLGNLLGDSVLAAAYSGFVLYAAVRVLDGLVTIGLRSRPAAKLAVVRQHRPLLQRRLYRAIQWLALFLWVLLILDRLSLRTPLLAALRDALTAKLTLGSLTLSLGDVLAFGAAVWAAFLLSRLLRFVLEEEVYQRFYLTRGLPYAVSTILHYTVLLVGFIAGLAALGLDMTKVTILAGAFSLGVGFGLQNIVNNFVSGLILLFERPVNVGDVIQIDDATGIVERIGIRASIIRTANGSEVIVPNGKLISDRVTNWTLSNRQRRIEIPVATATGTDPKRIIDLLQSVASKHAEVEDHPPPQAVVVKLGSDSLGFELRVWTNCVAEWAAVRSDLAVAISDALAAENIAIR
jgi:potassium-dependent mechanosensitive channel